VPLVRVRHAPVGRADRPHCCSRACVPRLRRAAANTPAALRPSTRKPRRRPPPQLLWSPTPRPPLRVPPLLPRALLNRHQHKLPQRRHDERQQPTLTARKRPARPQKPSTNQRDPQRQQPRVQCGGRWPKRAKDGSRRQTSFQQAGAQSSKRCARRYVTPAADTRRRRLHRHRLRGPRRPLAP
jgi:hypothetical protein